jgi:hypothetical protein
MQLKIIITFSNTFSISGNIVFSGLLDSWTLFFIQNSNEHSVSGAGYFLPEFEMVGGSYFLLDLRRN